jgi:hypothetical protein
MVGRTISHYRIVGHLGAGGMGVVYSAEDLRLGRPVALKFVSEDLASEQHAIGRLRSEARAASALNHPNICTIYDIGDHEGQPFIVMELMTGRTLRDRLADGPLKVHQLVDIGIEIADALQAAHAAGIVHRDIKPGNIFLTDGGRVKVLDFGLAKLLPQPASSSTTRNPTDPTGVGLTPGTISYMSPEQATGEELDGRTDLFSLGVVLYECATGRHPFPGKTTTAILAAILNRVPVAPAAWNQELPLRLQDVINNCLEKDRELRYQSAADLRADLKRVRRDLESGRSRAGEMASGVAGARSDGTRPRDRESDATSRGVGSRDRERAPAGPRSRRPVAAALVGAIAIVASGSYALRWMSQAPAPASPPANEAVGTPDEAPGRPAAGDSGPPVPAASTIEPSAALLARAEAELKRHDYQAALGLAEELLSRNAAHEGAIRIRDEARAVMRRRDAAISEARRHVAAGDLTRAARALDTARGIDPAAPGLREISSLLAELARERASARAPALRGQAPPGTATQSGSAAPPAAVAASPLEPNKAQPGAEPTPVLPIPAPPAPQPATPPSPPPVAPATSSAPPATPGQPVATERRNAEPTAPAAPSADEEEAAIRQVATTYGRAIENKDMALFRAIKPNLSREEERRLEAGFRAVTSQRVSLTIQSIAVHGEQATVLLMRRDTIQAGGRPQTTESQQTLTLARTRSGWVIVDIR